jgi:hypothetical protein
MLINSQAKKVSGLLSSTPETVRIRHRLDNNTIWFSSLDSESKKVWDSQVLFIPRTIEIETDTRLNC